MKEYSKIIDKFMVRHLEKPGITGWNKYIIEVKQKMLPIWKEEYVPMFGTSKIRVLTRCQNYYYDHYQHDPR